MKSRKKPGQKRTRSLFLEPLESRVVLAGNVRAFVSGGTLNLDGDSKANEIVIEQTANNQFVVSSRDGSTTINGQTGPQTFRSVNKNFDINMGNGADVVEIAGSAGDVVRVRNRLFINTGSGADQVLMSEVHALGLHINTGSGRDLVNVGDDGAASGLQVTKEAIVLTGSGQDDARIANSLFKRFLTLDTGSDNDVATVQGTDFRKRSTLNGSSGSDTLNRDDNDGPLRFISWQRTNKTVNTAPPLAVNAVDDAATIVEDATPNSVTGNVLTNDVSGTGTKTVTAVNGASGSVGQTVNGQFGTFQINANGTFTYTLNNSNATVNALNNGGTLTDSMNYTAGDGSTTDTATLRITIQGTTELNAVNDTGTVVEDASPNTATGNVLTNDEGGAGTKTVTAVEGGTVGQVVNGQFGTFLINANGTFTYTLNNSNATVNALNNGGTLTDEIDYTVTAGLATDTATLTITIQGTTELNAVSDTGSVIEDDSPNTATGNVLTNDTDGTGTKTVTAVEGGTVGQVVNGQFGTFLINANGTFTYTLNNSNATVNALNNGGTLTDEIDYTVTAGLATDTATLTITIQGHTELVAENDTGAVTEDDATTTATGNVLTNDTGGSGTKTVTAVEGGTGLAAVINGQFGTFQINADGSFTYTLDNTKVALADLNDGETVTDEIDYTVSDDVTTDIATLTITITGNTDAGAVDATDDTGTVTEDDATTTSTGNVLTNDTGSGTLTVTAVNGAAGSVGQVVNGQFGTFQINQDGTFAYTLDNTKVALADLNDGETLTDSMTYTAGNGTTSDIGTLTITINGNTDAGAVDATNDTGTVTEDDATTTSTGNVLTNDAGSGTLTVTAVNGAAGSVGQVINGQFGTFQINADGTFTYTLDNTKVALADLNDGETATDSMNYTVGNGTTTDIGTLTITINGNTDAGAVDATNDTGSVTEDDATTTSTGNVLTNDSGSGTLTVTAVNGAAGSVGQVVNGQFGTFQINADGTFTYTLDNTKVALADLNDGETATDSMNYTVGNGTTTDIGTLTITINGNTDAGAVDATNDTGSVTEDDATTTSTGNVLTNDTGSGTLTVTAVEGGAVGAVINGQFGTFQINADGTFTYTLDNTKAALADLNDGETVTDSIDYTAGNGTTSDIATLTITINGNTDVGAVDATNDTDDVTEDATPNTATGSVLTNDNGSGTLTVTAVDGVPGDVGQTVQGQFGTFLINADGTYTYTLDNTNTEVNDLDDTETLTDSINYTAGNGTTTDVGTLTITINGHTELAAVNDTGSVTEDDPTNTSTGNVLDNDTPLSATKTVTAVDGVPGDVGMVVNGQFGTFQINADGTFTYTLDNNNTDVNNLDNGETLTDSIEYTVSDGIATSIATLEITITGATDP